MKRSFKAGDFVFYGVVRGIIIGIYNSDKALFFSHEQRAGFKTRDEIVKTKPGASKILDYLIKEHFGYKHVPAHSVLNQHRFTTVSLKDLHHMSTFQITEDQSRLIRKRHLYIQMARSYMKSGQSEEAIHRICQSIEAVQSEIELEEHTNQNATGFATYE